MKLILLHLIRGKKIMIFDEVILDDLDEELPKTVSKVS